MDHFSSVVDNSKTDGFNFTALLDSDQPVRLQRFARKNRKKSYFNRTFPAMLSKDNAYSLITTMGVSVEPLE